MCCLCFFALRNLCNLRSFRFRFCHWARLNLNGIILDLHLKTNWTFTFWCLPRQMLLALCQDWSQQSCLFARSFPFPCRLIWFQGKHPYIQVVVPEGWCFGRLLWICWCAPFASRTKDWIHLEGAQAVPLGRRTLVASRSCDQSQGGRCREKRTFAGSNPWPLGLGSSWWRTSWSASCLTVGWPTWCQAISGCSLLNRRKGPILCLASSWVELLGSQRSGSVRAWSLASLCRPCRSMGGLAIAASEL